MTQYTPRRGLPYPEGDDQVAVHSDVQALADKVDVELENTRHEALYRYTRSHVAQDVDGQPYFAPGTGTTMIQPDIDGTPYFIPA